MLAVAFNLSQIKTIELRKMFEVFDFDNSGGNIIYTCTLIYSFCVFFFLTSWLSALSQQEFMKVMQKLDPFFTSVECRLLFETIDVNDDGEISFLEFVAATFDPRCVDVEVGRIVLSLSATAAKF